MAASRASFRPTDASAPAVAAAGSSGAGEGCCSGISPPAWFSCVATGSAIGVNISPMLSAG